MPSAQVTITQLPQAGAITGTEAVPIVQNGQTVQTTTGAIAASPSQNQTFVTVNQEPTLPNSRALSAGVGVGITDGGAQSTIQVTLNGAAGSLEASNNGIIAKTGGASVTGRTLQASGAGLSVTNGNGVSGNPTYALTGLAASLANMSGTGVLGIVGGSSITSFVITGTTNQIDVANGAGPGNPTISITSNPVIPGSEAMTLPSGTTGQRPAGTNGQIRFNTTSNRFEGYQSGGWSTLGNGDGSVTSVNASGGTTGLSFTGGPITTSGTLTLTGTPTKATNVAGGASNKVVYQTGVDTTGFIDAPTVTDTFLKWNGAGFIWSSLPGAGTVTSVNASGGTTGLTFSGGPITSSGVLTMSGNLITSNGGTGLTSYTAGDTLYYSTGTALSKLAIGTNGQVMTSSGTAPQWTNQSSLAVGTATNLAGGAAGSIPYQTGAGTTAMLATSSGVLVGGTTPSYSTAPTLTGTNFTSIPNGALQNSSITLGSTSVSLGGTAASLAGLTTVTVTQAPTAALQLATKQYVDDQVATGIDIHTPVRVETPTALNASYTPGGTAVTITDITGSKTVTFSTSPSLSINDQIVFSVTSNGIVSGTAYYVYSTPAANQVTLSLSYNGPELTTLTNGTGLTITGTANAGVGATLTNAGANAAIQIDGVTLSATNRVLVYNQANAAHNGIYTVTTVGAPDPAGTPWVLTRATDADKYQPDSTSGLGQGDYVFVQEGSTGAGESYVLTTPNPLIIGTTNQTWTQFAASQVYSAGTGLTLNGTQFSITNTGVSAASYGTASAVPTIAVNAQGQITSAVDTAIAIAATAVTSGTLNSARLTGSYTGITGVGTLTAGTWNATTIGTAYGGTGVTSTPTNGQILIGNGTGYTLATLTAGTGVSITNGAGSVTINSSGATIDDVVALAIALG